MRRKGKRTERRAIDAGERPDEATPVKRAPTSTKAPKRNGARNSKEYTRAAGLNGPVPLSYPSPPAAFFAASSGKHLSAIGHQSMHEGRASL